MTAILPAAWQVRHAIRTGRHDGPTAGLAPGFVQGNVAIVPAAQADDFARFCRQNSKACQVIGTGRPGDPALPALGQDIDIRTDLPRYRIYRDGIFAEEVTDATPFWRDDLVTFVIGCSFTFERALLADGIPVRHMEQGRNVPMYRTNRPSEAAGPFGGNLVVSMRPMPPADAVRAAEVTARYPDMHGAPLHQGDPAVLGIADLDRPDFGESVRLHPGDVPVFWACGVTSQTALEAARLPLAITHAPGCMLITDVREDAA